MHEYIVIGSQVGRAFILFLVALLCSWTSTATAQDHFDAHTAALVSKAPESKAVKKLTELSAKELAAMPHPLNGASASGFLVVKTDQGNWCKLLLRQARRKTPGKADPVDLFLIERLVTYPADIRRSVAADVKNVYLFDGFGIDLDLGAIVPAGMGDDLKFSADPEGGKLQAVGDAQMFAVGQPLVSPPGKSPTRKFSQGAITPADFAGAYTLKADGRWSGELVLKTDENGKVTGTYKSEQSGETYDVTGQVGDPTNRVNFKVTFPMTEQEFEGYLWTRERGRITGVTHMLGRPFGFQADRKD